MRALVFDGTLRYRADHPRPVPAPGEAVVAVTLAGICNTDLEIVKGYMGFAGVPGHEFVGVVEQCEDSGWVGRRVVGEINCPATAWHGPPNHCPERTVLGIVGRDGAFADYLSLPVANLHAVPDPVSDEQAVYTEPLAAALRIPEEIHIRPTDRIAVLGDGKLGQLCARVLARMGASVLAVGRHRDKLALLDGFAVATMGPEDLPERGDFDVVVEATGSADGLTTALRLVRPQGTVVLKSTVADGAPLNLSPAVVDEVRIIGSRCGPFAPALALLPHMRVENMTTEVFPLEEGLAAFDRAASRGVMKVLLRISD